MRAKFVGNTLTRSEAIEIYTPHELHEVTGSRPRKTTIAFFANFGHIEKLFCAGPQLKFDYESMQHRLQFSGIIKMVAKNSFYRHFNFKSS